MAIQLYVKLQSPTIELSVKAQDVSGAKDTIKVGFKRYEAKAAKEKLDKLSDILASAPQDMVDAPEVDAFIKAEVVYLASIKLDTVNTETGLTKELAVADTRTAKPVESLWDDPDECLDVLLSSYLASAPWRLSLVLAAQKALFNNDYEAAAVKN